ncbi:MULTISPECIES: serine/threonine-protein kinase [Cyanophyceae]|uniref:non-specific serine/threonine protein kinase n=1 Tax=Nodularia spumigena CENA596 TaxID=1819295 RepID=A0A161VN76_NODSP|nr:MULTISPECIES: serine/threonine-protein kinase [Cyanophyceae]MDB9355191.1 serine/threonine-protein kinase [Nodularia spumigena CS-587/03]KZL48275.1 serine/threonine protein kinase [Nodularia spumigena CENA596]MDB9340782.1 serine/threonine-protein kinase [Nodularia spumigena CS-589/07]MDB9402696.1 serine/threonine-protein kinase [Microcystis aeruginosa CS-567/02-A1]MDB9497790.1 serine/threonine-protein kinase [Nodularia spumigena CS-336/02]
MKVYCTRPSCPRPENYFADLETTLKTTQQKYCTTCGMPLLLYGRYVPTRLLGKGGFGTAFLARDRHMPGMRKCVVKQFQPAGSLSSTQLEQAQKLFEREAEVLAQIGSQHDQIPDLFAFFSINVNSLQAGEEDQFFYLVQEYIDGQNLEEELIQNGKFSEQQILEVLQEILKVLQFVHDKKIIHRDIKPSNIMRRRDGRLFLLDFGAVKQVTNAASGGAASSTGIYSMGFAPPEQMSGNQVFPSTDLYALAVTLLNLLTGEEATKLFDAYTNQWKWRNQVTVSPHLADILDKMLLPAANQRFQSADDVLAALSQQSIPPTVLPKSQPPTPTPTPTQPPQQPKLQRVQSQPAFSTWELLGGAAFSGFEGALIAIALYSLLRSPIITLTAAAVILGILIFAQTRRWIEKFDLLIIPGITFAIILFVPFLRAGVNIPQIAVLAVAAGLVAISVTAIFRLIYKLISLIF